MPDNEAYLLAASSRTPWNKGKLIGATPPLRPKHVWAIRTRLMIKGQSRDLAMFNLAIDSSYAVAMWWPSKLRTLRLTAHSLRRTKATLIYRRTGNLQSSGRPALARPHKDREHRPISGVEVDDALAIAEQVDV